MVDQHQGLFGVGRCNRPIAEPDQLGDHVVPHQRIVLDDQYRLGSSPHRRGDGRFDRFDVAARGARKIDLDAGAMAILAIDLDVAARLLDESVHHAQAEAGSLANFLGGEERIKHLVEYGRRDAGPGVADRDHRVGSRGDFAVSFGIGFVEMHVAGFEGQFSPIRHGIARIDGKVDDRRGELTRVDQCRPGVFLKHRFDLDLLAKRRPEQPGGADDQLIDINRAWVQRLLAGEGQKTLRQFGAALRGLVDHRGNCRELGLVGDGVRQDLDGTGDDGENVVEVVGNAAGQLADGFHLLCLRQLLLLFDQLFGSLLDAALEF